MDFLSEDRKPNIGFFSESCRIFTEDINRAFLFFRNAEINSLMDKNFTNAITIEKGKDTWTVGNIYSGDWVGVSPFTATVTKYIDEPHYKEVEWHFQFKINLSFVKVMSLYDITDVGGTLVVIRCEYLSRDEVITGTEDNLFYKKLYDHFLIKASDFLKNNGGKYYNYESCLIKQNQRIIWEYLTDMNKANSIEKIMADHFDYKGNILTPGTFIKGINKTEEKGKKTFYLKVTEVHFDENSNEWKYKIETFGASSFLPSQEILLNVIHIKENITQVGVFHNFKEIVSRRELQKLGGIKKNFLIKIKRYFEHL